MKIKPTDKVVVKVKGEGYERYGSGGIFSKTYVGSWENVLNLISEEHSYGTTVGEDEWGDVHTCEDVLQYIEECNGDGCDFIFYMKVKKGNQSKVLIEEDRFVEEEEIYCD